MESLQSIARGELTAALSRILGEAAPPSVDRGANGLQVAGGESVSCVVTGVSVSLELIERAIAEGAQAIIVHHGLMFPGGGSSIGEPLVGRLKALFGAGVSLYGYHYLLDSHREIGNAAQLAASLGATVSRPFGFIEGAAWGWEATLPGDYDLAELIDPLEFARGSSLPADYRFGREQVRRIGIVTGSGSRCLQEAVSAGLDALIVGEVSEGSQEEARELRTNLVGVGHYWSETFGPRALAASLEGELGIRALFIDVPNEA